MSNFRNQVERLQKDIEEAQIKLEILKHPGVKAICDKHWDCEVELMYENYSGMKSVSLNLFMFNADYDELIKAEGIAVFGTNISLYGTIKLDDIDDIKVTLEITATAEIPKEELELLDALGKVDRQTNVRSSVICRI